MRWSPDQFDVDELARLARLDLDDGERELLAGQLRRMIDSFNRIGALSTDGVDPFPHAADHRSALRRDEPSAGGRGGKRFTVPRLPGLRQGGRR